MLSNLKIRQKFILLSVIPLFGFFVVAGINLYKTHDLMMQSRMNKTKNLVEVAYSAIAHFYAMEENGTISREKAQTLAKEAVKNLRYDESEYFWINDNGPTMIMHPYKPQLDGQDLSDLKDPAGIFLFKEMVDVVNKDGAGYVRYMWSKPGFDKERSFPKLSYVKGFKPWGWIIGSGIYIDDVQTAFQHEIIITILKILIVMMAIGLLSYLIARNIVTPLKTMNLQMRGLASGENSEISGLDRKDELGDMAQALQFFKEKLHEAEIQKQREAEEYIFKEQRQTHIDKLTSDYEHFASAATEAVAAASTELMQTSELLLTTSGRTKSESDHAAVATSSTSQNVATVASATEELSSSVKEISQQIDKTTHIITNTVQQVKEADQTSKELSESANQIGAVINLIRDIADQINLLALNATIESARAGEAGKGFAVVASEVKNLANQTSSATDDVEKQISNIQNISQKVVDVLNTIGKTVTSIAEYSTNIASAMEEQEAVTSDISFNMQNASQAVDLINENIKNVQNASDESKQSSEQVYQAAQELSKRAEEIHQKTQIFLKSVREA